MSRHRNIRNLNITDELDDTALSDGGEEVLTPEQQGLHDTTILASVQAEIVQAQMNDGLDQVKLVIGGEALSGLSDSAIRDMLWEYYFDTEKTIQWALEERERLQLAKQRRGDSDISDSSSDMFHDGGAYQYHQDNQSGNLVYPEDGQDFEEGDTRSRLPSIFLAQQQPGFDNQAYLAVPNSPRINRLSTITERTERTEPSMLWRPRQQSLVPNTPRSFVSSDSTDYGQQLDHSLSPDGYFYPQLDPNTSGASPSGSAIQRLSTYDPPPSNSSTISPDDQFYPVTASEPRSSLNNIPSIPDLNSKTSEQALHSPIPTPSLPEKSQSKLSKLASSRASTISTRSESLSPDLNSKPNEQSLPHTPTSLPSLPNKSQSKLSKMASSRASTISTRSESSRSSGTAVTGSIKTFPALRPSAQSERPPSSIASSKDLPPLPSGSQSSTSSIVRRAIQTALDLEAVDKEGTSTATRPQSLATSEPSDRAKTPTPMDPNPIQSSSEAKSPLSKTRPVSKLALLAQQKAGAANQSLLSLETPSSSQNSPPRPLSKLAMLAEQKVDATRVPKLPKPTTEYLTPIANGSSVTTAITTSYQSLYSLTDPSRPNVIPKLNVVPLQSQAGASTSPSDPKPSKLAMKIRRAGEKVPASPGFPSEEKIAHSTSPIFQPKSTLARASPSAFASVLIHNNIVSHEKGKEKEERRKKKEKKDKKEAANRLDKSHSRQLEDDAPSIQDSGSHLAFAFDGPSPDDIVLNARKRTPAGSKALLSTPSPRASGKS